MELELFPEMTDGQVEVELHRTLSQIQEMQEDWSFVRSSECSDANLLGEGAGCLGVYGLMSPTTRESFAVKLVDRHKVDHAKFRRELDISRGLQHPGICRLRHFTSDENYYMLVLERCDQELFEPVAAAGGLPEPKACEYFGQIIDAVDYLHSQRVYHRDLKLENVLLTDKGAVKISDFGMSRQCSIDSQPLTRNTGTLSYMAPEMLKAVDTPYDGAAIDVWSCGVLLYVMVCCEYPFGYERTKKAPGGQTQKEIVQAISASNFSFPGRVALSDEFKSLITGMLTVDVSWRLTIAQIREHPWFIKHGYVWSPPAVMPSVAVNLDDLNPPEPLPKQGSSGLSLSSIPSLGSPGLAADDDGFSVAVPVDEMDLDR